MIWRGSPGRRPGPTRMRIRCPSTSAAVFGRPPSALTMPPIWASVAPFAFSAASKPSLRFRATSRSSNRLSAARGSSFGSVVTFSGMTRTSIELNGDSIGLPNPSASGSASGWRSVRDRRSWAGSGRAGRRPASAAVRRSSSIWAATSSSLKPAGLGSTVAAARSRLTTETSASATSAAASAMTFSLFSSENRRSGLKGGMSVA